MTRIRARPVTLRVPLRISGYDGALPAGAYFVETKESCIDGLPVDAAYLRLLRPIRSASALGRVRAKHSWNLDARCLREAMARGDVVMDVPARRGGR